MPLSTAEHILIRAEFDSDPPLYDGLNDQDASVELNIRDKTQVQALMTGSEVWGATNGTEFDAIADAAERTEWLSLCGIERMDPSNSGAARDTAVRIFGLASATVVKLAADRQEQVSRASQIGVGKVTSYDVAQARAI